MTVGVHKCGEKYTQECVGHFWSLMELFVYVFKIVVRFCLFPYYTVNMKM